MMYMYNIHTTSEIRVFNPIVMSSLIDMKLIHFDRFFFNICMYIDYRLKLGTYSLGFFFLIFSRLYGGTLSVYSVSYMLEINGSVTQQRRGIDPMLF